jgi:hypothetical protein
LVLIFRKRKKPVEVFDKIAELKVCFSELQLSEKKVLLLLAR